MILNKGIANKILKEVDLDFCVEPTLELLEYLEGKGYLNTEAMERDFADLKVGDIVRVINWGNQHTTYPDWVVENVGDKKLIAQYAYGDDNHYRDHKKSDRNIYKILALDADKTHAYIAREEYVGKSWSYPCYIIGTVGIQKVQ